MFEFLKTSVVSDYQFISQNQPIKNYINVFSMPIRAYQNFHTKVCFVELYS